MEKYAQLFGRILLAAIFVLAGIGKLADQTGTMQYMTAMGVPSLLMYPTIFLEVLGGLAIMIGYQVRYAAIALAGFSVLAALLFHTDFVDKMQVILFMKNMSMAGGLLLLSISEKTNFGTKLPAES
jgi:putative oxidoreductase